MKRSYHVESYNVFEGDAALVVCFDEVLIYQDGRGTGREAEDEWVGWGGCEVVYAVY